MKQKSYKLIMIFGAVLWLGSACRPATPTPEQLTRTPMPRTPTLEASLEAISTATRPVRATDTPTTTATATPAVPSSTPTLVSTAVEYDQPIWGIHVHGLGDPRQIKLANDAGGYWTRFDDFKWDEIEPQRQDPPVYRWDRVDEEGLSQATQAGLAPIGIVLFAPRWAQAVPGIACGPIAEPALQDFVRFLGALVARYSQPPYEIHAWELGNEPDVAVGTVDPKLGIGCWGDPQDTLFGGGKYAQMLKVAYPAIKAADPQAIVLVGGLVINCDPVNPPETTQGSGVLLDCQPSRFIEGILANGGGDYFDAISFHAYDYFMGEGTYANSNWSSASNTSGPVVTAKTTYLKSLLSTYGYPDKLLFNTEVALLCGRDGLEAGCRAEDFLNTKANYAAQANVAAKAAGIAGNIWYSLTGWRASGLVDRYLTPAAAYGTYQTSVRLLSQVKFVRMLDEPDWMIGYEFTDGETRMWVVWAREPGDHSLTLEDLPDEVIARSGDPLLTSRTLNVGLDPVYILWRP